MLHRDMAYSRIKKDILIGTFQVGDKLSPPQLASRYNLGISPVREALRRLQEEGLVKIVPQSGCFVAQTTIADVQDMFDLRTIIEGAAAEMAARNITEEQLRGLEEIGLTYVYGVTDTYLRYLEENREFHHRVALASGNRRLADLVDALHEQMQVMLYLQLDLGASVAELIHEHQELMDALRQRNGELARQAMVDSISHTRQVVLDGILHRSALPVGGAPRQLPQKTDG